MLSIFPQIFSWDRQCCHRSDYGREDEIGGGAKQKGAYLRIQIAPTSYR